MTFTITIPGRPVSGNHANRIGKGFRRLRDGSVGSYPKIVKTPEAEAYMVAGALIARRSIPRGWTWDGGFVVTEWRLFLAEPIDFSNVLKVVEDIIFPVLGVNDAWDMPRCMEIVHGCSRSSERVEVTITGSGS